MALSSSMVELLTWGAPLQVTKDDPSGPVTFAEVFLSTGLKGTTLWM